MGPVQVHGGCISGADIAAWPCSVSPLCKFSSFLRSLHWLAGAEDKGHFRVSYLEVLILSEQWAGHQLLSEKVTRSHFRAHHQISISSVLVSEGVEIRQRCRFISCLVRSLGTLPGGLGRFCTMCGWQAYVHASAPGLGAVFPWVNFQALSPSMPQGCVVDFQGIQLAQLRSFWMVL